MRSTFWAANSLDNDRTDTTGAKEIYFDTMGSIEKAS